MDKYVVKYVIYTFFHFLFFTFKIIKRPYIKQLSIQSLGCTVEKIPSLINITYII